MLSFDAQGTGMETPVIEFKNVTKRFGDVTAVVDNNLKVKSG
jgi:ABC-type Fe3+/spermidine/putrescine transport system ATPase subunit